MIKDCPHHIDNSKHSSFLLRIRKNVDGFFTKDVKEQKYLDIKYSHDNADVLDKYEKIWDEIRDKIDEDEIEIVNEYEFMKFKIDTEDAIPMDINIKVNFITVFTACVLELDGNYYYKACLTECYYTV